MFDRRLHAFRPDLAEQDLEGRVEATRFVRGDTARIATPVVALRPRPDAAAGIDTELLLGEEVTVFDRADGWAWAKAGEDGYVGYLPEAALATEVPAPTHRIAVPRSFVYPRAELRSPVVKALSMGSRISVIGEEETRGTRYFLLADGGAVIAAHCLPVETVLDTDPVTIALRFLETPYLWGGRSGFGLDCSGLVQLSLMMAGRKVPRDTDMQAAFPAEDLERHDLRRGDLVFWKGHVGFMEDEATLLHANGHTMTVARENFDKAVERIGWLYQYPTAYRRLVF
ncbi:NlpC/P60 family protein [Rhizobium sp. LjRoot30]|uniref:C40 family peptidase n=1 Tax=Rhizobium sp. LjRoot30 TaxID=3342320 RepID=UPI003ECD3A8B